ncbi:MAG: PAS domain-containing protein [Clostridia bacterium]|nr:PAS domain-containing protein [Clostridia bacterium]
MKKKIFYRFFAVAMVSVLLMFAVGMVAVNLNGKNVVRERLVAETELASALLTTSDEFEQFDRYSNSDDFRVTVMSLDGNVLYESDTNETLANHADRQEVLSALAGTPKAVERYSDTFGQTMTYYAVKTTLADGTDIVLRLAIKNSQVASYLNVALPLLIVLVAVAIVVCLVLANTFAKSISKKFVEVGDSLKSLNKGQYVAIDTNSDEPELYAVLNEINDLNANMLVQIAKKEQERQKLSTVLSNISQGIIAHDGKNKIVFINNSAINLFGAKDDMVGKELVYLVDNSVMYQQITSGTERFEVDYKEKQLSVFCKKADGSLRQTVDCIIIITDITAEKAVAKQKSEFFVNASHELKTPVTVMQGLSEILLSKQLDDSSKKQVERIHKESIRLASLIADMLKLSKLEDGQNNEVCVDVDLRAVVDEVFAELSDQIKQKEVNAAVCGDAVIKAHPKKIFELVQNLVSNALHYNKQGGQIDVSIDNNKDKVVLTVKDTGIGIEQEHIPHLCERFYRVDKSRSKKTGGTGLGLAIVKHICALYKANLSISSQVDVGTTITVCFNNL